MAAARWGLEPRPRDSEPDLIGVGRRELERVGTAPEAPGCASPAAEGARPPRRLSNGPPSPSARPWLPPPQDPVRPAAHNDSWVASPSPAPPLLPRPDRAGTHSGKEEQPGPARHLRRRTASPRRASADADAYRAQITPGTGDAPYTPPRSGEGPTPGIWRWARTRPRALGRGWRATGGWAHSGPAGSGRGLKAPPSHLPPTPA